LYSTAHASVIGVGCHRSAELSYRVANKKKCIPNFARWLAEENSFLDPFHSQKKIFFLLSHTFYAFSLSLFLFSLNFSLPFRRLYNNTQILITMQSLSLIDGALVMQSLQATNLLSKICELDNTIDFPT
jgi:hypothetical protein